MNQDSPSPSDPQLYLLVRQFDEALALGASTAAVDESATSLHRAQAEAFEHLRQCVSLLESVRRQRGDVSVGTHSVNGATSLLATDKLPQRIGRFELRNEIGRGGCGVVFLAHDPTLTRDVAIKLPRPEALVCDEMRERFLREARAAGTLDHPNVVPIFEVGEDGPVCYIAAAYVDGPSLATWLRQQQVVSDVREAATLVASLAGAVEQAHSRGVIHRDIKPANILLQPLQPNHASMSLSRYVPKLTDFGLAKLHESTEGATCSGTLIGTPAYMAPEQARGDLSAVGPATDVYALGAILYELLTGSPPLRGESDVDTLRRIVVDDPPLLRYARPGIGRDIEAICMKCLEKRPEDRYGSAAELSADLRRFLADETTVARPIGPLRRLGRWSRRRPATAALVFVSVASLTVLSAGSLGYNARLTDALKTAETERSRAETQQQRAENEAYTSRQLLYSAEVRLAYDAWGTLNRSRMIELLSRHIPAPGQKDLREFAWHWLWRQCHAEIRSFTGHTDEVFGVAFSPNGESLATASKDGTARIWDVATGKVRHILREHTDEVICAAYSPDGTQIATGSEDQSVCVWDAETGALLFRLLGHENHVLTVAFSPDGRQLASGGRDDCVRLWELETRQPLRVLNDPTQHVRSIRYSPDGQVLAACDEAGVIHRWDTSEWNSQTQLSVSKGSLFAIDFQSNSRLLAAGRDATLFVWNLEKQQHVDFSALMNHGSWIRDVRIAPNGKMAATCNHNGFFRLWDIGKSADQHSDALLLAIPSHAGRVWNLAWSPDGRFLATAGADKTVKLWNVASHLDASPFEPSHGWVWTAAFAADSTTLVTASQGGTVRCWDLDSYSSIDHHGRANAGRASLAVTRDGKFAATAARYSTNVRYLNLASGDVMFDKDGFPGGIFDLDISPDGKLLAVGYEGSTATILELTTGKQIRILPHDSEVDAVTFSPNGRTLATCSRDLRLWDVRTGALLWARRHHESGPRYATFSPNGNTIAIAVGGDNIGLVDASSGDLQGTLLSDRGAATCLAFSPDGHTLAVGLQSPTAVALWDMRTHQELCAIDTGLWGLLSIAFSPDGKRLIAAGHVANREDMPFGTGQIMEWTFPENPPR